MPTGNNTANIVRIAQSSAGPRSLKGQTDPDAIARKTIRSYMLTAMIDSRASNLFFARRSRKTVKTSRGQIVLLKKPVF